MKKVELCKGMTTSCSTSNGVVSPSCERATHNLGINQFGNNFKSRTPYLDENLCMSSHDLFDNQAIIFASRDQFFKINLGQLIAIFLLLRIYLNQISLLFLYCSITKTQVACIVMLELCFR
jgi:hypothetical protein